MNEVFPERRRSTRYLTQKNAAIAAVAIGAVVAAFSMWHQLRPARSGPSRELLEARVPSSDPRSAHHQPVTVIEEGTFHGAEAILVDARPTPQAHVPAPAAPQAVEHRLATIAGGPEGVQLIVKTPARAPAPH